MSDAEPTGPEPHADPAQFDRVVESAGPDSILVVIARSMSARMRARYEPEDVWQETLAQAWRDRDQHRWTGSDDYRTWLVTIARNRLRDMARTDQAEKRGGTAGAANFSDRRAAGSVSLADVLPAGSVTPSRVAFHNERARIMLDALARLPDEVEPVVRLHLFEERTMDAIAAELGIGVSAAWHRFRKGSVLYRDALRALQSGASRPRGE